MKEGDFSNSEAESLTAQRPTSLSDPIRNAKTNSSLNKISFLESKHRNALSSNTWNENGFFSPSFFLHTFPRTARNPPPSPKPGCKTHLPERGTGSNVLPCYNAFTANTLTQLSSLAGCSQEHQGKHSSWTCKDDNRDIESKTHWSGKSTKIQCNPF